MAETSKTEMMIKEETKELSAICERLVGAVKHEVDKGIENVETKELGEAIDMIKDLSEAKEKVIKGCYYKTLMEAMEEAEYGVNYDENGPMDFGRRGYDEMMPMDYRQMEQMRDMDRDGMSRMYYSGSNGGSNSSGGSINSGNMSGGRDYREGRSGQQRRSYMETKELHKGNTAEDKQKKLKSLEDYMSSLGVDISEMISDSSTEEKNMIKTKLQTLAQKIS